MGNVSYVSPLWLAFPLSSEADAVVYAERMAEGTIEREGGLHVAAGELQ